ncbi:hypothetical protein HanPI659440_Chr09g0345671 [Helianthus annuus]|nr:hypothetical protein HanPI659440_Chr09g0345671 [Helianthus annuus]
MSASRRHAQTFGSCSLFVFQKHFSPFTSSPPLPHADISPPLLTSSLLQNTTLSTATLYPRHHLHHHISATTSTPTSPPLTGPYPLSSNPLFNSYFQSNELTPTRALRRGMRC